ncbi:hypothetical protein K0U07_00895 [bacterium]|nr:hypothetical protein [bacterium]
MELSPRKRREILVQLLYLLEGSPEVSADAALQLVPTLRVTKKNMLSFFEKAKEIFNEKEGFDSQVASISEEYALDRIAKVDLAILRVILFELDKGAIPVEVAVSEALRIAHKFSSFGAGKYLHAMIDSVFKQKKLSDEKIAAL